MTESTAQAHPQSSRRRVPRWVWFVVVCMVLGMVTSVGVAWGLMWRSPVVWGLPQANVSYYQPAGTFRAVTPGRPISFLRINGEAPIPAPEDFPFTHAYWRSSEFNFPGVRVRHFTFTVSMDEPDLSVPILDAASRRALIRHEALLPTMIDPWEARPSVGLAGWPFLCLAFEDAFSQEDADFLMSFSGNPSYKLESPLRATYNAIHYKSHLLPTFPLWPGLLANTAIYAGAWAVLIGVPVLLRRWLRARCGGCPQCGYSREGLKVDAPCPECGRTPPTAHDATPAPAAPIER